MDSLELVNAVAPYATAIVAIFAAAFTAWLSHRNRLKQFSIQRSEALLKEQIRLMQEVPKALNDALAMAVEALYSLACSDAFAKAQQSAAANSFMDSHRSYQAKLLELLRELELTEIAVRIYFGEQASQYVSDFRSMLLKASINSTQVEQVRAAIGEALASIDLQSDDMQAVIAKLVPAVMPHIALVFAPAKELRLAAVRAMASRVNAG